MKGKWWMVAIGLAALVTGCATLDRAYQTEVTWGEVPVVETGLRPVVLTNIEPQIVTRERVVLGTNEVDGAVSGYVTEEPVATNLVTVLVTNTIPVFETNLVQVPVTNLVASPAVLATIGAVGAVGDTYLPGIGSMIALLLGSLYHGYRQIRNRKVNEALVQGVETARAILETTPQGKVADAQFVKWLMEHQKEAGVFATVATLVDNLSDHPAAKLTAQEIAQRVKQAQRQMAVAA
jgi:hypothetical protein